LCAPASEHRVEEIFAGKNATHRHLRAFTTGCGARSPGRPRCQHTVDRAASDSRHARRCLCQTSSAAAGPNSWLRHCTAAAATRTPTSLRASTPCCPAGCDTIGGAGHARTCESLGQHWAAAQVGNDARNFSHECNMARKCECMRAYFWPPPPTEREVARDLEVEPTPQLELGNKRD
jgi:hypothetical protein